MVIDYKMELDKFIVRFDKIYRFKSRISLDAFLSCMLDYSYLHNLIICKNTPSFLEILLKYPSVKYNEFICKYPDNESVILEDAQNLIEELEVNKYHQSQMKKYNKKYNSYFKYNNKTGELQKCNICLNINPVDFRQVYLDYNATSNLRSEVIKVLQDNIKNKYGFENPSSNTAQGNDIREQILNAKRQIASFLFAKPENIIFTGSGSEANNLAIKGMAFNRIKEKGHIITSKIEHASVLESMRFLSSIGFEVTYLDVEKDGIVNPRLVKEAIKKNTFLVSIMAVNNEIGTINPINEIGAICLEHNICFMVDAVQAFGKMIIDPQKMGISLLTFSGHKIYAPKGIGGLYIKEGLKITPIIHGGGQEYGLRSGTENVPLILALAEATKLAYNQMVVENDRLKELRDYFLKKIIEIEPQIVVNGSLENRISNNLNLGFPEIDSGILLKNLNRLGISVSTSSACSSRKNETSHVLIAIGADTKNYGSIRFSFGLNTSKEDLDYVIRQLQQIISVTKRKLNV